ncbi:hypothetical protein AB0K74_24465 [Streptomyces sp. NPDC056159]|uniref:hypothetical protein n=1 Tax=Streptomyces sp. NPDC056159 TaxID=3155537 RepID=UPI003414E6F4
MSANRIWKELLTVERAVVEQVEIDQDTGVLVARVRPVVRERNRCGICRRPGRGYDQEPPQWEGLFREPDWPPVDEDAEHGV